MNHQKMNLDLVTALILYIGTNNFILKNSLPVFTLSIQIVKKKPQIVTNIKYKTLVLYLIY